MSVELNPLQSAVVDRPLAGRVFLEGPAGAGKTTAAVQRLLRLLKAGVPGGSILVAPFLLLYGVAFMSAFLLSIRHSVQRS